MIGLTSREVLNFNHFRTRLSSRRSILASSLSLAIESGRDFEMYRRLSPFRFSLEPSLLLNSTDQWWTCDQMSRFVHNFRGVTHNGSICCVNNTLPKASRTDPFGGHCDCWQTAVVLKSLLVWDDCPADPNYGRSGG